MRRIAKKKSMFAKSIKDHSGDVQESLELPWSVSECSWVIPDDLQRNCFLIIFSLFSMCSRERRVLHTPSLTKREFPK